MLKDEGGTEDKRARKLQYSIKLNNLFIDRVINDEEITLFDPKVVPELIEAHGENFDKFYLEYENKPGIKKIKIKARELAYLISKVRNETGNLYCFFDDNANKQTPFNDYINSSNLCQEIMLPSKGSVLKNSKLIQEIDKDNNIKIVEEREGLISLCNLSSIVLNNWINKSEEEKEQIVYYLLSAHDNEIDTAMYPVKEGEIGNKLNRPIGIGINGLAFIFAQQNVKFSDEASNKVMFDIMEDVAYHIYSASNKLAKERGVYKNYFNHKWSKGWLPIDEFRDEFLKYADNNQKQRWEELRENIKQHGVRFSVHIAIAPTATSSNIAVGGTTEGIEPIKNHISVKNGTYTQIQLAPRLRELGMNYELAWDIPNERLLKLAQIRQIFIDQSQSVNTYTDNPNSAYETFKDIKVASDLGLKSLYYLNIKKQEQEECFSCSS